MMIQKQMNKQQCLDKLFSSWIEFDHLKLEEVIIKVNEFFKYED